MKKRRIMSDSCEADSRQHPKVETDEPAAQPADEIKEAKEDGDEIAEITEAVEAVGRRSGRIARNQVGA